MESVISDTKNPTLNKFMFGSESVRSNIMNDEIINVIDSSSCDSSVDQHRNVYFKCLTSTALQEKLPIVEKCTNEKRPQRRFSYYGKSNIPVNHRETYFNRKRLKKYELDVKKRELISSMKYSLFGVQREKIATKLKISSLKHRKKICFITNKNGRQHCSTILNLKRTVDLSLVESELNKNGSNKTEIKKVDSSNSYCVNQDRHIKKHLLELSKNPSRKRSVDYSIDESGLNIHCSNQEKKRKVDSSNSNSKPLDKDLNKHISSCREISENLSSTNNQLNSFKEKCNDSPTVTQFINSGKPFFKYKGRILRDGKEEFVQPFHMKFSKKPKNMDLCRMRKLHEHQMAGYNCYRSDFTVEYDNEAEQVLGVAGHLNDLRLNLKIYEKNSMLLSGIKSKLQDDELLEELEIAITEGYNSRLQEREKRKTIVKEFGLINQKAVQKWRNKLDVCK